MSGYCQEHFLSYFEQKVHDCIVQYDLIPQGSRILVGVSGGKDSLTILYLLNKWFSGQVTALAVDEGIAGYRDVTLADAIAFCTRYGIPLLQESLHDQFAVSMDVVVPQLSQTPCSVCGVFRRYLLNKHREFDVIATGHNLDDEAQSIVMNLIKNQLHLLANLGPKSGIAASEHFLPRVKPLYFCAEKEVMTYSYVMGFKTNFVECPYAQHSFRLQVRDALNLYEYRHPSTKRNIVQHFIDMIPRLQQYVKAKGEGFTVHSCSSCGEPSMAGICKACQLTQQFTPVVVVQ